MLSRLTQYKTNATFSTSPSVYLQILGTAVASDECTVVGPTLTSPILSFPPGALSTWKPPPASDFGYTESFAVGDIWQDPNWALAGGGYSFSPLTIKDLACPTWGLGRSTSADGSVITTIGPPWLPLIAPPMELLSLDPTWASLCTGFIEDRLDGPSILLFDPPIALTLGAGLVPFITPTSLPAPNNAHPTTVPEKQTASSTPAAKPANSPTGSVDPPVRTADPPARTADPPTKTVDPPLRTIDPPSRTADAGRDPMAPPSKAGDPATLANQGDLPPPGNVNPASDPVDPPSGQGSPVARKSDITQTTSTDLNAPSWSTPRHGDGLRLPTPELGALIYYAFEKSGPETVEATNQKWILTSDAQDISIGTDQILSIDPSEVKFQGKVYSIGGSGITLSNSAYTVVVQEKPKIHTGSVDQSLGNALPPPTAPITLTIAAVGTIISNPKGLILNSAAISPGGSAHTFDDGTKMIMISLDPSGNIIVASSTIPLLASHTLLSHHF